MADDDMKLQQPVEESNVPDIPKPETEVYNPILVGNMEWVLMNLFNWFIN